MRIGTLDVNGNVFLAPMAGITDGPFRRVVQRFGVSALWTEMLSAEGLLRDKGVRSTDIAGHMVPTVFQLYGRDPATLAEAARLAVERGAAAVDINMGCPARKVVSKGSGVALMLNMPLAVRIVSAVRRAVSVPLTVKMRSGWSAEHLNAPEFAQAMEAEGADAVIVHCRSRSARHSGPVALEILGRVKDAVRIPVIGNGGIKGTTDARHMIEQAGCDGVMLGRGALGRPWIPGRILKSLAGESSTGESTIHLKSVIHTHFQYHLDGGDAVRAVLRMRKHLVWYSNGLSQGTEFRRQVFRVEDPETVLHLVNTWFEGVTAKV